MWEKDREIQSYLVLAVDCGSNGPFLFHELCTAIRSHESELETNQDVIGVDVTEES